MSDINKQMIILKLLLWHISFHWFTMYSFSILGVSGLLKAYYPYSVQVSWWWHQSYYKHHLKFIGYKINNLFDLVRIMLSVRAMTYIYSNDRICQYQLIELNNMYTKLAAFCYIRTISMASRSQSNGHNFCLEPQFKQEEGNKVIVLTFPISCFFVGTWLQRWSKWVPLTFQLPYRIID